MEAAGIGGVGGGYKKLYCIILCSITKLPEKSDYCKFLSVWLPAYGKYNILNTLTVQCVVTRKDMEAFGFQNSRQNVKETSMYI